MFIKYSGVRSEV